MSNRILILAVVASFIGLWTIGLLVQPRTLADALGDEVPVPVAPGAFAVVELFTSEGCSSCPPADRVAASLAERAARTGEPIHVIAFHVDYWDRLGWPDRFGSAAFSRRQREYARVLRLDRIYTPQMIINGRTEFVGSNVRRAKNELEQTLARPGAATIRLERVERTGRTLSTRLDLEQSTPTAGLVLHMAVVESGLTTEVHRGENRGRRLEHAAVARAFTTVPVSGDASIDVSLTLPVGLDPRQSAVIAYAQDPSKMRIVAAARRSLQE